MTKITHTPNGLADILYNECELKEQIESTAKNIFKSHGYKMVQAPMFEYYDVYDTASTTSAEDMFKFFDNDGRMLALRPDITTSVARMAATKFASEPYPLKLFYIGSAFRNDEAFSAARQREFTQTGIELLGDNTPQSDAEVIEIAIDTLVQAGLVGFQIEIGQIQFFKGLLAQAGLTEQQADQMRDSIDKKDFIALEKLIDGFGVEGELKNLLLNLPNMFGGIEIADNMINNPLLNDDSRLALQNLCDVYSILQSRNLSQYISIDLGMVPNLYYYTGIMIKGFTHGMGFPILNGGRYDNLAAKFGRNIPATGVSISVERVMAALSDAVAKETEKTAQTVTVALAKGRLADFSVDIFDALGYDMHEMRETSRKLIFEDKKHNLRFIYVKTADVPTYVEYGAADIGIVGKDTILEEGKNLYEVLDLGFGKCKMAVAGPAHMRDKLSGRNIMRVASKYPAITKKYFHVSKGQTVDIIKLNGSVELAPLVGLSEVIVDIVESGKTLKENGLEVLENICDLSARLIVNRVSMKIKRDKIIPLIDGIKDKIKVD